MIFLVLQFCFLHAKVSEKSASLERLRLEYAEKKSPEVAKKYLKKFPKSYGGFRKIFYGEHYELDELYPTHLKHLYLLKSLSGDHEEEVLYIYFSIAKDAKWEGDALNVLQGHIKEYFADNVAKVADLLMRKNDTVRFGIVRFLADVENHYNDKRYAKILEELKKLEKYSSLYELMRKAREERMKHRHD